MLYGNVVRLFGCSCSVVRRFSLLENRVHFYDHHVSQACQLWYTHQVCQQVAPGGTDMSSSLTTDSSQQLSVKGIECSYRERELKLLLKPDQPPNCELLRVAILGLPNCGKSTLTNTLMGWRVSSVSSKVHTTRKNTFGIFTHDIKQIVFLDTPGILHPKSYRRHNVDRSLVLDPARSLLTAHLVDVGNIWLRNVVDQLLLKILHLHSNIPAVLVLNKIDLVSPRDTLLQIIRSLTKGVVNGQPVGQPIKPKKKKKVDLTAMFDATEKHHSSRSSESPSSNQIATELSNPPLPATAHWTSSSTLPPPSPLSASSRAIQSTSSCSTAPSKLSPFSSPVSDKQDWSLHLHQLQEASAAIAGQTGWPHFCRVFCVSARSGEGVDELREYLLQAARPSDWDYHSSLVTLQEPVEVAFMCIREKLLDHLRYEIPYKLEMDIAMWEVDTDDILNVIVNIYATNTREMSAVLGSKGQTILQVAAEAKQEMMNTFRCEMRLKLVAKLLRKPR